MAEFNPWSTLVSRAADIVDQLVPDKDAARRAKHELAVLQVEGEQELRKLQAQANVESAKHGSVFVAGARPAVIWMLVAVLGYHYIGYSLLQFFAGFYPEFDAARFPKPIENTEDVMYLMMGLLGMGGWRSWDKKNGAATRSVSGG